MCVLCAAQALARAVGWEERAVERWFRKRRNEYKAGGLKKFRESSWKFTYYTIIWLYGVYILYDVRCAHRHSSATPSSLFTLHSALLLAASRTCVTLAAASRTCVTLAASRNRPTHSAMLCATASSQLDLSRF